MKEVLGKEFITDEFNRFKRLQGNRSVTPLRVKKLMKSISEHGYIGSPAVINEKWEIVDGQARVEACRVLNEPIPFVIREGAGIKECVALNRYTTTWSLRDYIEMYVEYGNESYIYLLNLMKRYERQGISLRTIFYATTGLSGSNEKIKSGQYVCDKHHYEEAIRMLDYVVTSIPYIKKAAARKDYYFNALCFTWMNPEVDNSTMIQRLYQHQSEIIAVARLEDALMTLEQIYNYRTRKKVYLVTDYKKANDRQFKWYSDRFPNRWAREGEAK